MDFEGENLVIQPSTFFSIDGIAIDAADATDIKLFYYNAESQESLALTELKLAICSNEDLDDISSGLSGDTEGMLEVINSLYGKCGEEYLLKPLKSLE